MEITLQCFPKEVRDRMPNYTTMNEMDFLLEADRIANDSTKKNQVAAATPKDSDSSDEEVNAIAQKYPPPPPNRPRSTVTCIPGQERRREREQKARQTPLCYYHRRFRQDAFRCLQPCGYKSKNL